MDPAPDPTSDPTALFSDITDAKKIFIFYIFFFKLTCRHIIFSLENIIFLPKFCVKILFYKHYISPLNNFMRKGKDPEPDPYI
jgi:hypothetical protein